MDVFETHEHEFSELSASITDAIQSKVKKTTGESKRRAVRDVEADLEELRDIVEQMELEIRDMVCLYVRARNIICYFYCA